MTRTEFAWRTLIVLVLTATFILAWELGQILILTFGGIVIAVVIRLAADPIAHVFHFKEKWASLLVLILAILALAAISYFFGNKIAEQFDQLQERLPRGWERIVEMIGGNMDSDSEEGGAPFSFGDIMTAASTTYSFFFDLILVLLVAIYLSFNPQVYRRGVIALMPKQRRALATDALDTAGGALRGWLKGQLACMATVGTLTALGLWAVGVPLALTLGLIAGVLEFIPILGPFMAAVPGVILAFTEGPTTALYAVLVYLAVQQAESSFITPLAQRWAVALPPALNIFGLVVLGTLFGLPGLIFAAPLTVVTMVLVQHLYVERQGGTDLDARQSDKTS